MVLIAKPKRRQTVHHKRRHGTHHKRTSEYHNTYWPYLPLGLIVGLGMMANAFWPAIQQVLGYATNTTVSSLVSETNDKRSTGGLGSLTINPKLNQAAQAKANDMAARNYWSHNTPDGNEPWVFLQSAGYSYIAAGENLAYGFADSTSTVSAWMNSPGHRANIMNSSFAEVGFGIADVQDYQSSGQQTIVVAMYGQPQAAPAAEAPSPPSAAPTPAPSPPPVAQATPVDAQTVEPKPLAKQDVAIATNPTDEQKNEVLDSKSVARIQLLAGDAGSWSVLAVTILATVAFAVFFLRHGLLWHKVLAKSEKFIVKHPFLDIALVVVAVVGVLLTRSAGSIY